MVKVVVLGASGGIGQPLSLLLKTNLDVTELSLFDIVNTPGVAADLSHICTTAKVTGFLPPDDGLKKALTGADIVVIPAGVPRKPGMTRDDLFKTNAGIVRDLATGVATSAPNAYVLVISNPVNSTVPIVCEVFKKHNVFNPKRIFGVTTLDVVRSSTFVAEILGDSSKAPNVVVPVVGGHSGTTIIPLLSQSNPPLPSNVLSDEAQIKAVTDHIQFGGDEVVKAKDGLGSATLSMAYAGAVFAEKVIKALKGQKGIVAPTFVHLTADPSNGIQQEIGKSLEYFSANVELSSEGVGKILALGKLSAYEKSLLDAALPQLEDNINKGVSFVQGPKL